LASDVGQNKVLVVVVNQVDWMGILQRVCKDIIVMMDLHMKLNQIPKETAKQGQTRATDPAP
jgi:hypothetical protein